jgi:hypothetical protein
VRYRLTTLLAIALTLLAYAGIAWLACGIQIPVGVPTARLSWIAPFRVVATLGFALASSVGVPHLAGDLLAAILLGGALGGVFALSRRLAAG